MPYDISVDPGLTNLGIAIFNPIDNSYVKGSVERLCDSGLPHEELAWAVIRFVQSGPYKEYFLSQGVRFVVELNDIRHTRDLSGMFATAVLLNNKTAKIFTVHPFGVTRFFRLGGITRVHKKKLTLKMMNEHYCPEPDLLSIQKFDLSDACLNYLYAYCRKFSKPKKQNPFLLKKAEEDALHVDSFDAAPAVGIGKHVPNRDRKALSDFYASGRHSSTKHTIRRDQRPVDDLGHRQYWDAIFSIDRSEIPDLRKIPGQTDHDRGGEQCVELGETPDL